MVKEMQNGRVNWDIPAGGLDQGELLIDGVCREIREETGIIIKNPCLQRIFQFKQDQTTSFNYLYSYNLSNDEVKQINITEADIEEIRFFSTSEIKILLDEHNVEHELARYRLLELYKNQIDISISVIEV